MTPQDFKEIRESLALSCDGMAAVLRLEGKNRKDMVRGFESGAREPSPPIKLIYETLDHGFYPTWWLDPVSG